MNITIQINDEKGVSVSNGVEKGNVSSGVIEKVEPKDGGAPTFSESTADEKRGDGDSPMDIGGPPAWLTEEINQGRNAHPSDPATNAAGGEQNDAGSAPQF